MGDQNNPFFYRAMKNHHSKSKIMSISREDGTRVEEPREVKKGDRGLFSETVGLSSFLLPGQSGHP